MHKKFMIRFLALANTLSLTSPLALSSPLKDDYRLVQMRLSAILAFTGLVCMVSVDNTNKDIFLKYVLTQEQALEIVENPQKWSNQDVEMAQNAHHAYSQMYGRDAIGFLMSLCGAIGIVTSRK